MYEFKITVEIPGLAEAISNLAAALSTGQVHTVCNQHGTNNHHIENVGTVNMDIPVVKENPTTEAAPVQTAQTSDTVAPTTAPDPAPATVVTTAPAAQGKSYTVDDLSRAGATLIDQGKMPQLIDLLKKYGVQAVTQLDASQYPAFVEDMKALGAAL